MIYAGLTVGANTVRRAANTVKNRTGRGPFYQRGARLRTFIVVNVMCNEAEHDEDPNPETGSGAAIQFVGIDLNPTLTCKDFRILDP
jgi:hypothetical protein